MKLRIGWQSRLLVALSAFIAVTCAPDYKDLSSPNGRQAILDLANNYLTSGDCDAAISTILPLIQSIYVTHEARMVYSSAYGCKGGMSMGAQLITLKEVQGSDIWTPLVKSNYTDGTGNHVASLNTAADIIRQTSNLPPGFEASSRLPDANVYMIFVQVNAIISTISPMGRAEPTTGKKTLSITGLGGTLDRCVVQVAIATIADSLRFVSAGAAIQRVADSANAACQSAFGGPCPLSKDLNICMSGAAPGPALQAQGQLLINAIDTQWSF